MDKEYAGTDLAEIRAVLADNGYTGEFAASQIGFDLFRPFNDRPQHECSHVVVWPRREGGYWQEEY